ncbi:MAG: hypothetical protein ACRDK7_13800 [Solirubrobacteraceae bacterium]
MTEDSTPSAAPSAAAPQAHGLGAPDAHLPAPPSERGAWLVALALGALGVSVLAAVLSGVIGRTSSATPHTAPPAVVVAAVTPAPSAARSAGSASAAGVHVTGGASGARGASSRAAIVARPSSAQQAAEGTRLVDETETEISQRWMEGFYPIYATAQKTFGVNWLLIASIHRQESAFSTAPTTYHGLNFAGCCGGPMQFNVTNGDARGTESGSTWDLVSDSYKYGRRPAVYDHKTATHPSIYDDFDAIMAAAHLLSADGAEYALNGAAWDAAYDYYGHDTTGVSYADEVLARAIGWSQHSFCINCGVEAAMVEAVHAAYGAPVLAALEAEAKPRAVTARAVKPRALRG